MLLDFRERGREGERGGETLIGCFLGTEPATQACALTGNQTHNLSGYGMMLQPTEPHEPGQMAANI